MLQPKINEKNNQNDIETPEQFRKRLDEFLEMLVQKIEEEKETDA